MSKKNMLFSICLLILSVCFITDVHAEVPNTNEENIPVTPYEEETSRWEAVQPIKKVTSEGLIIEANFDNLDASIFEISGTVNLTVTIPEDYNLDTIVISYDIFGEIAKDISQGTDNNFYFDNAFQSGDGIKINLVINNLSKFTYLYDETSFEIFPKEDIVYDKVTTVEPSDEETPLFNDLTVNENYHFMRAYNTALQALIPNSSAPYMTDENVGAALINAGYANGIADLAQYMLDFYNAKYDTNYTRLDQFPDGIIREILCEKDPFFTPNSAYDYYGIWVSPTRPDQEDILNEIKALGFNDPTEAVLAYYNEVYQTNATRIVDLPEEALDDFFASHGTENMPSVYETNPDLIALSYDYFYNKGLSFGFEGDEVNSDNSEDYAIGEYMRDEAKGDDYITTNAGTLAPNTNNYTINGGLYTAGNYLMNSYLGYEFNIDMQLTYSALKGTVIAKYVDINGNVLADDVITNDMVGKDYQTFLKYFDGYNLYTIEGEETGQYINGVIEVVYIYAKDVTTEEEPGTGSTSAPVFEITPPKTGISYQNENVYYILLLALGAALIAKPLTSKK